MTSVNIDLSTCSDEQLMMLQQVCPDDVKAERERRNAYATLEDGLNDLVQAGFELEQFLESVKNTAATRAVKDTNVVQIIQRLVARARIENYRIKKPELKPNGSA